jgi:hypothetical protein
VTTLEESIPREVYHAFGDVAMRWAMIEHNMDFVIRAMLDHHNVTDVDTALILPFKKRSELFADLCRRFTQEPILERALVLVADMRRVQHKRDFIIHGIIKHCWRGPGRLTIELERYRWERPAKVIERRKITLQWLRKVIKELHSIGGRQFALEPDLIPWETIALPPKLWQPASEDPIRGLLANLEELVRQRRSSPG